ncbi:MAG: undecaprenyl-diphosphate phosphatase [Bacteroidales bacterium]|jgi:undecaprenyl-diphosphatase|nr:undecaprenyl-diphosphate phosphatase [Bacteroidales bacterium]
MTYLEAIIIAIVEGLTEFLPVSSTGHMIITEALLGIEPNEFSKAFTVNIQLGAILAVVVMYFKRFFQSFDFYLKLGIACIPLIIAFLLEAFIDQMLESVLIVAMALFAGGIILIFVDNWFKNNEKNDKKMSFKNAFIIGLFQVISVIPGVSRSAASIIGGMTQCLSRKQAAEFSFFLAVPTMLAATCYKLFSDYETLFFLNDNHLNTHHINLLLLGNLVAFVVALIAIKAFIAFLTKFGFRVFGYYRIIIGSIIIILLLSGVDLKII